MTDLEKLEKIKDFCSNIQVKWFAERPSISEAYEYANEVMKNDKGSYVALHVVMNTIGKEILSIINDA